MFEYLVRKKTDEVRNLPCAGMLSDTAMRRFEQTLHAQIDRIAKSSIDRMLGREAARWNPIAESIPALLTKEDRIRAGEIIRQKVAEGAYEYPEPLLNTLTRQLDNRTDAFVEMLERLEAWRGIISDGMGFGRSYTRIMDIELSVGDTHNHGRSVAVVSTDAGRFVYKPHDMTRDVCIYKLVEAYFSDDLGIARSMCLGKEFGVSEYIEKERLEGAERARSFWYKAGVMAAFLKMLGSTDMHVENIICARGKPYILDLETVLSPVEKAAGPRRNPETDEIAYRSIGDSLLPPRRLGRYELSVLFNREEAGCGPRVDGKNTIVVEYLQDFLNGYDAAYRRIVGHRGEIKELLEQFPDDMPVRVILRNTGNYMELTNKLYHYSSLADADCRRKAEELLLYILTASAPDAYKACAPCEKEQICRGDVPYVYALAKRHGLYSGGTCIVPEIYEKSPVEHALDNLSIMCGEDEAFDLSYMERVMEQYPAVIPDKGPDQTEAVRPQEAFPKDAAVSEAKRLLEQIYSLRIEHPNGHAYWGSISSNDCSFRMCDATFSKGLGGMSLFAAACGKAVKDDSAAVIIKKILREMKHDLGMLISFFEARIGDDDFRPETGEYSGLGGTLKCLSVLRMYDDDGEWKECQKRLLALADRIDYSKITAADRIEGLAGLLSVLCRFTEYKGAVSVIVKAADRILQLQNLEYDGIKCWKTISTTDRPLSGAGHGMAGIAEALYAAARVTGDEKYRSFAGDALLFEQKIYETYAARFGSWADLRTFPPDDYMHGYCSGAPGIGIMVEHILDNEENDAGEEILKLLKAESRKSVDALPLNVKDHLCCGNSAVAEYYMTCGDRIAAGRVLSAMYNRCRRDGEYRYRGYDSKNSLTPSIMDGISGIGYEMLRYAYPEMIIGLL